MPTYTFVNKTTGEQWSELLSIGEMSSRLEEDKNLDVLCGAPLIGDPFRVVRGGKPANHSQFRDTIQRIKQNHPLNTIDGSNL